MYISEDLAQALTNSINLGNFETTFFTYLLGSISSQSGFPSIHSFSILLLTLDKSDND